MFRGILVARVEVSLFAFVTSIVPAVICTGVLIGGYMGSAAGREALFGPAGLLGWTQTPGLALTQVLSSLLGGGWMEYLVWMPHPPPPPGGGGGFAHPAI